MTTEGAATASNHPRGLYFLTVTELAERFSYYGMVSLLPLYLGQELLLPGHAEKVIGLAGLRALFEFGGPMSNLAFASLIVGWYGGLVYFTPIIGGWIGDRWLGIKRAVILGIVLMSMGHLAMTYDQTFLIAGLLLILGSGFLKGNISAQVGTLYPAAAESLRDRGYAIYSTGINFGAVTGPVAVGTVAAIYGWHTGFGLATALMLVALAFYLAGLRHFPATTVRKFDQSGTPAMTSEERGRAMAIVALIALIAPIQAAYAQIWNIGIVWIDQRVDLVSPLGAVPASWFVSLDSVGSILIAAPLVALWARQARAGTEPTSIAKIAIGAALIGASALLLATGALLAGNEGRVSVLWVLAGYIGMGIGFMWYWPVMLALVSRVAPVQVKSTLMGGAFLALFAGSLLMGWVGSYYDQLSGAQFWLLDASIGLGAALAIALARRPLEAMLDATPPAVLQLAT